MNKRIGMIAAGAVVVALMAACTSVINQRQNISTGGNALIGAPQQQAPAVDAPVAQPIVAPQTNPEQGPVKDTGTTSANTTADSDSATSAQPAGPASSSMSQAGAPNEQGESGPGRRHCEGETTKSSDDD